MVLYKQKGCDGLNIAICDDSKSDAIAAKDVISQTAKNLHIKAEIDYFLSAAEVENKLLKKKEPLDLLILDIDMPQISGLELAERLRASNLNLLIIFLSNHEEFVFRAIEFQPFRYIRKIKLESEMPLAIRSAAKIIEAKKDKQIVLNTDDGEMRIMISEIMYYEADKRKTIVHLENGKNCLSNKNITELSELIKSDKFIMIHRSCVVNADFIRTIKNDIIIMKNSETILISRRKTKDVKQQILRLWGDKI